MLYIFQLVFSTYFLFFFITKFISPSLSISLLFMKSYISNCKTYYALNSIGVLKSCAHLNLIGNTQASTTFDCDLIQ